MRPLVKALQIWLKEKRGKNQTALLFVCYSTILLEKGLFKELKNSSRIFWNGMAFSLLLYLLVNLLIFYALFLGGL